MNKNYLKLNFKADVESVITDKIISEFVSQIDDKNFDIRYHEINDVIREKLFNFIPSEFHSNFTASAMVIKSDVFKHIDDDNKCNLNFYVNTGNSITHFYEPNLSGNIVHYGNTGIIFLDELKCIDSFIPKNSEVYLINTTVPHSVTLKDVQTRLVYTVHCDLSFEQAATIFSIPQG